MDRAFDGRFKIFAGLRVGDAGTGVDINIGAVCGNGDGSSLKSDV